MKGKIAGLVIAAANQRGFAVENAALAVEFENAGARGIAEFYFGISRKHAECADRLEKAIEDGPNGRSQDGNREAVG